MSTAGRSMRTALRMRVSMSANESVIMLRVPSPASLLDARNQAIAGHVAETNTADAELAIDGPRPAAQPAAQPDANPLARRHLHLGIGLPAGLQLRHLLAKTDTFCFSRHASYPSRNGMPKDRNNSRASSSLFVLVTNVTSIPCTNVILSGSTSGNTDCSLRPRL